MKTSYSTAIIIAVAVTIPLAVYAQAVPIPLPAGPTLPTVEQAQAAFTAAQSVYADLVLAWNALQPLLSFIALCAGAAAAIPHPSAGSLLAIPRKLLDIAALNIGHAKNAEKVAPPK